MRIPTGLMKNKKIRLFSAMVGCLLMIGVMVTLITVLRPTTEAVTVVSTQTVSAGGFVITKQTNSDGSITGIITNIDTTSGFNGQMVVPSVINDGTDNITIVQVGSSSSLGNFYGQQITSFTVNQSGDKQIVIYPISSSNNPIASVKITGDVTYEHIFNNFSTLQTVDLTNQTGPFSNSYNNLPNLTNLSLPSSITEIVGSFSCVPFNDANFPVSESKTPNLTSITGHSFSNIDYYGDPSPTGACALNTITTLKNLPSGLTTLEGFYYVTSLAGNLLDVTTSPDTKGVFDFGAKFPNLQTVGGLTGINFTSSIKLPDSVTAIQNYFLGNSSTISKVLNSSAYDPSASLTPGTIQVIVPDNLSRIDTNAFDGIMDKLEVVKLKNVDTINSSFRGVEAFGYSERIRHNNNPNIHLEVSLEHANVIFGEFMLWQPNLAKVDIGTVETSISGGALNGWGVNTSGDSYSCSGNAGAVKNSSYFKEYCEQDGGTWNYTGITFSPSNYQRYPLEITIGTVGTETEMNLCIDTLTVLDDQVKCLSGLGIIGASFSSWPNLTKVEIGSAARIGNEAFSSAGVYGSTTGISIDQPLNVKIGQVGTPRILDICGNLTGGDKIQRCIQGDFLNDYGYYPGAINLGITGKAFYSRVNLENIEIGNIYGGLGQEAFYGYAIDKSYTNNLKIKIGLVAGNMSQAFYRVANATSIEIGDVYGIIGWSSFSGVGIGNDSRTLALRNEMTVKIGNVGAHYIGVPVDSSSGERGIIGEVFVGHPNIVSIEIGNVEGGIHNQTFDNGSTYGMDFDYYLQRSQRVVKIGKVSHGITGHPFGGEYAYKSIEIGDVGSRPLSDLNNAIGNNAFSGIQCGGIYSGCPVSADYFRRIHEELEPATVKIGNLAGHFRGFDGQTNLKSIEIGNIDGDIWGDAFKGVGACDYYCSPDYFYTSKTPLDIKIGRVTGSADSAFQNMLNLRNFEIEAVEREMGGQFGAFNFSPDVARGLKDLGVDWGVNIKIGSVGWESNPTEENKSYPGLGGMAFRNIPNLESVEIGKVWGNIYGDAFAWCDVYSSDCKITLEHSVVDSLTVKIGYVYGSILHNSFGGHPNLSSVEIGAVEGRTSEGFPPGIGGINGLMDNTACAFESKQGSRSYKYNCSSSNAGGAIRVEYSASEDKLHFYKTDDGEEVMMAMRGGTFDIVNANPSWTRDDLTRIANNTVGPIGGGEWSEKILQLNISASGNGQYQINGSTSTDDAISIWSASEVAPNLDVKVGRVNGNFQYAFDGYPNLRAVWIGDVAPINEGAYGPVGENGGIFNSFIADPGSDKDLMLTLGIGAEGMTFNDSDFLRSVGVEPLVISGGPKTGNIHFVSEQINLGPANNSFRWNKLTKLDLKQSINTIEDHLWTVSKGKTAVTEVWVENDYLIPEGPDNYEKLKLVLADSNKKAGEIVRLYTPTDLSNPWGYQDWFLTDDMVAFRNVLRGRSQLGLVAASGTSANPDGSNVYLALAVNPVLVQQGVNGTVDTGKDANGALADYRIANTPTGDLAVYFRASPETPLIPRMYWNYITRQVNVVPNEDDLCHGLEECEEEFLPPNTGLFNGQLGKMVKFMIIPVIAVLVAMGIWVAARSKNRVRL